MKHSTQPSLATYLSLLAVSSLTGCGASVGAADEPTGTSAAAVTVCGMTTVTGIDVYHGDNNGNAIDWSTVKSGGASFAFAKATESTTFNDPMFATNWSGMKEAGLVRGAYHFYDPTADATAQATFFLAAVGTVSPGDMLVLDFETSNNESDATLSAAAVTFLSAVQTATGVTPLLYASSEFLSDWGGLGAYPLWVANYGQMCPDVPSAWTTYTFWQSSGTGMATGIDAPVDVDSFNGTLAQLQALGSTTAPDAGPAAADAGTDTGSTVANDSGSSADGAVDSGTSAAADSGAGLVDSGASVTVDSGSSGRADSGRAPPEPEPTPGPAPKGCACTGAGQAGPSWAGTGLAVALGAILARRRRARR